MSAPNKSTTETSYLQGGYFVWRVAPNTLWNEVLDWNWHLLGMGEQENTDFRREKRLQSFIFMGRFQKWFPNV